MVIEVTGQDLLLIPFLTVLETILSIDNALVLAMLARNLPKHLQKRALTYGLLGAFVFRLLALSVATILIKIQWVKMLGGLYLLYVSIKHFLSKEKDPSDEANQKEAYSKFWQTVLVIELTDMAFAVDSIMAAVGLTNKLWIVFAGGFLGVLVIRFAANFMIGVLDRYPALEETAYRLVFLIGAKVVLEALNLGHLDFHDLHASPFWIFWGLMIVILSLGFKKS